MMVTQQMFCLARPLVGYSLDQPYYRIVQISYFLDAYLHLFFRSFRFQNEQKCILSLHL